MIQFHVLYSPPPPYLLLALISTFLCFLSFFHPINLKFQSTPPVVSSMAYQGRSSSISETFFTLTPLPYPVLLLLAVISIFLGASWYTSYESVVESAEQNFSWLLLATPVALILLVRWLSSIDNLDTLLPWDRSWRNRNLPASEGGSPWAVAALIGVLLVMMQYQSSFLQSWFF